LLTGALIFLVQTVCGLFVVTLLLRFYLQWARAPHRNPISDFLHALTDFMVRPARRLIPGLWGLDLATLLLAWLLQFIELLIVLQIQGFALQLPAALLLSLVLLVKTFLYIAMVAVFVQALLSLLSPHSPAMPLLNAMTRPMLRVFQRRIPPVGNFDLSPLFVLVIIQLLLMLPVAWLEMTVPRLF